MSENKILKNTSSKKTILAGTALCLLALTACSGGAEPNVELLQDMMVGPQYKPQRADSKTGRPGDRLPPEGAIPRGRYVPADLKLEDAEKMANPLKSGALPAEVVLKYEELGQEKYEISCTICHGSKGDGQGPLVQKRGDMILKKPPSLLEDTYVKYSDGRIYYVITYGWGLMGHYTTQMPDANERWAVVNYVRQLQKLGSKKSNSGDK